MSRIYRSFEYRETQRGLSSREEAKKWHSLLDSILPITPYVVLSNLTTPVMHLPIMILLPRLTPMGTPPTTPGGTPIDLHIGARRNSRPPLSTLPHSTQSSPEQSIRLLV